MTEEVTMFRVASSGWLKYQPFAHYRLPSLESLDTRFELSYRGKGTPDYLPGYRLRWPGEMQADDHQDASIPAQIVEGWPAFVKDPDGDQSHYSVSELLERGWMPDPLPNSLAYHLAINHHMYKGPKIRHRKYSVAGLPALRVDQVLEAEFGVSKTYFAAIQYLKWLAEGHRQFPLFRSFDTSVRDMLGGIAITAAQLYFKLIGDCIFDRKKGFWYRGEDKYQWWRLASYLHWVGRTGVGLYAKHAGIEGVPQVLVDEELSDEKALELYGDYVGCSIYDLWDKVGWEDHGRGEDRRFHAVMPDVFQQMRVFQREIEESRIHDHVPPGPPEIVEKEVEVDEEEAED